MSDNYKPNKAADLATRLCCNNAITSPALAPPLTAMRPLADDGLTAFMRDFLTGESIRADVAPDPRSTLTLS